ncbi:MAG: transglycosylase domain-containing protein, partial [Anaerolineales bacterium]|nr:transglycosylase domain-containing protein [Anaerolineales bacterium]
MTNEPFWPEEEDDEEESQEDSEDLRRRFRRLTGEDDTPENGEKKTRPADEEGEELTDTARRTDDTATIPGGIKPATLPYQSQPEAALPGEDEVDLTGGLYGQGPAPDSEAAPPAGPSSPPVGEPTGGWYGGDSFKPIDVNAEGIDGLEEIEKQALVEEDEISESDTHVPFNERSGYTPPPPPLGQTPLGRLPAVDRDGMPLPRRVTETDLDATHVSPAAYIPPPPPNTPPDQPTNAFPQTPSKPAKKKRRNYGCFIRMLILSFFAGLIIVLGFVSYGMYMYFDVRRGLPDVEELYNRTSQFETTRILDRNGNLLYEILDPNAGRRTYVPLDKISPYVVAATVATEDELYYSHPGFSPIAIVRAFYQNTTSGETVSGASTITQQVARTLLFDQEEANRITYRRKVREALLAQELTRRYTKDEILEIYLNENNYGNLAYGIEAAAQTYFGISADKLDLAQASFLVGIPQAPAVYDPYTNREATFLRQQDVLRLMIEASEAQNCIYVSNNEEKICVDLDAASPAVYELENYEFQPPDVEIVFPHWVNYIRSQLEEMYDPQTIYRSGFTVYTTLDPGLQQVAQAVVQKQVANMVNNNAQSGALVAIQPSTGEILAMVGSVDFYNEDISGQVNMATSPRQPGSSIKPVTYTAAFEKGWTPATLIWDVESEFPASEDPFDPNGPYVPVNYDERYHGPVRAREALANSYNIPAVKALEYVGIYDNPDTVQRDGLIEMAERLGITTLDKDYYGYSLTLGGGEVTLLDLTGAYSVFANGGRRIPPVGITKIVDHNNQVVYEYAPPEGDQVIRAEHAYLISSILSDNAARTPAFGANSVLNLPFTAAAKTGTT